MPYAARRRYTPRNRRFRRKPTPWYNKKYNAMDLAMKAYTGVKYIKGLVNSEMFHIGNSASTTIDSNGQLVSLTPIAQGDNDGLRSGNSVLVRKILNRFWVLKNTNNPFTGCRIIFFIDTQQIADTAPAVTDVLASASVLSPLNSLNAGRFKILKNYEFMLDDTNKSKEIKFFKDVQHHVRFNGTASGDVQKGGIYMLYISSDAPGANAAAFAYNYKVGYHDN